MPRTLPPVRSPLSAAAILRGWRSATSAREADLAEAELLEALRAQGYLHAVRLTDSGTSALALAIRLAVARSEGPVALPAYGCFDLATAVDAAQVDFVLYDVDPRTLGPDLDSLARAVDAGARSIVVAHLYGIPVDVAALRSTFPSSLIWMDDAAQGVGAALHGLPLGVLGQLGVLSFGRGKGLTGGGGGALLVDTATDLASDVSALALGPSAVGVLAPLIKAKAQWLLARPGLYSIPRAVPFLALGETVYGPPRPATQISKFALGLIAAGVKSVRSEWESRTRNARHYAQALAGEDLQFPVRPSGAEPGWLRFPILLPARSSSDVRAEASARLGIMPGYPCALSDLEGFGARRRNVEDSFPGARMLAQRLITLPTHGALSAGDLANVVQRVRDIVAH